MYKLNINLNLDCCITKNLLYLKFDCSMCKSIFCLFLVRIYMLNNEKT